MVSAGTFTNISRLYDLVKPRLQNLSEKNKDSGYLPQAYSQIATLTLSVVVLKSNTLVLLSLLNILTT